MLHRQTRAGALDGLVTKTAPALRYAPAPEAGAELGVGGLPPRVAGSVPPSHGGHSLVLRGSVLQSLHAWIVAVPGVLRKDPAPQYYNKSLKSILKSIT